MFRAEDHLFLLLQYYIQSGKHMDPSSDYPVLEVKSRVHHVLVFGHGFLLICGAIAKLS